MKSVNFLNDGGRLLIGGSEKLLWIYDLNKLEVELYVMVGSVS